MSGHLSQITTSASMILTAVKDFANLTLSISTFYRPIGKGSTKTKVLFRISNIATFFEDFLLCKETRVGTTAFKIQVFVSTFKFIGEIFACIPIERILCVPLKKCRLVIHKLNPGWKFF